MSGANTPSGRIVAAANAEKETKDILGRSIFYRRLGALDKARLFKAVGPQNAPNAPYVGMALLASSATMVDGVPLPFPATDAMIEAAIARLGDEGLEAVAAALVVDQVVKDNILDETAEASAAHDTAAASTTSATTNANSKTGTASAA
jgi:hypothetical protein